MRLRERTAPPLPINTKAPSMRPGPSVFLLEAIGVAAQSPRHRGSAEPAARKSLVTSVRLDVAVHARVGVAASFAGMDRSAFMARVIGDAVRGIVIIDKRKSDDRVNPTEEDRHEKPEP